MAKSLKHPFQADPGELQSRIDEYVDAVFSTLTSFYLELPVGAHFVQYEAFRRAYRVLADATGDFRTLDPNAVEDAVRRNSLVLVVLRCMVGLSPPELADLATETTGITVDQGFARGLDQRARDGEDLLATVKPETVRKIAALVKAGCESITKGPGEKSEMVLHRLDKIDTAKGLPSLREVARRGVEYPALLYERLLGRPFASHRDSVSEMVGDLVEDGVAGQLEAMGVVYYKTKRAERVKGFDQAPDFLIPGPSDPKAVIEAKLTQDDGTARDKVTRLQHLDQLSGGGKKFEVIACIDGRGFRIRREDMKKLLLATRGKVFTLATLPSLVEHTSLYRFARGRRRGS